MSLSSTVFIVNLQRAVVGITAFVWHKQICTHVPEPYLDEVFHIRQAQAYLRNQWHTWDPKITTPPGLYLVTYLENLLLQAFGYETISSPRALRFINVIFGGLFLVVLVRQLLFLVTKTPGATKEEQDASSAHPETNIRLGHTALNICLFPPLFFFYGLYYTDVLSALSVLFAYRCYLRNEYVKVILAGLASLLFRQTNVFWVAIFLGGLELIRTLPRGRPDVEFPRRATFHDVILGSWHHVCIYDPLVGEAIFEDYIKAGVSIGIATVMNLFLNSTTMFWNLSSYVLVLAAFVEFVFWNGGVVLGDKDNHVASIHLAQMLYIWPYFLFFSLPILAPYLLNVIVPQYNLPRMFRTGSLRPYLPRAIITVPILAVMLAIIHYNTIVHPFTLADNRHYMFYVFRILLRHPLLKYTAIPIYYASAWACLTAFAIPAVTKGQTWEPAILRQGPLDNSRVSLLLIWLITTALSLCTAPLVEPRYLIVPWLIWRIHITPPTPFPLSPAQSTKALAALPASQEKEKLQASKEALVFSYEGKGITDRLWHETAWFLLINSLTIYIFLYWGFEWPQEPGNVQRFMW